MSPKSFRSKLVLGLIFGVGLARATDGPLPLTPGTYVIASYKPCEKVALAGVVQYDDHQGFFSPHESDCKTTVLSHTGNTYRVQRTCRANGDGTPATPSSFDMKVRIKSPTSFVTRIGKSRSEDEFDLCPAFR